MFEIIIFIKSLFLKNKNCSCTLKKYDNDSNTSLTYLNIRGLHSLRARFKIYNGEGPFTRPYIYAYICESHL